MTHLRKVQPISVHGVVGTLRLPCTEKTAHALDTVRQTLGVGYVEAMPDGVASVLYRIVPSVPQIERRPSRISHMPHPHPRLDEITEIVYTTS